MKKETVNRSLLGINPFDEETTKRIFEEEKKLEKQCFLDDNLIRFNVDHPYDDSELSLSSTYNIKLQRCNTPEKIVDWIDHLSDRPWMTKELIKRFIELACRAHAIRFKGIA